MQDSVIANFLDQTWKRVPVITAVGFIVYFIVLITIGMTNFVNRVNTTAELTNDMNTKQLPEIRERLASVETRMTGVETRLTAVETRLTGVEARLTTLEVQMKEALLILREMKAETHSQKSP